MCKNNSAQFVFVKSPIVFDISSNVTIKYFFAIILSFSFSVFSSIKIFSTLDGRTYTKIEDRMMSQHALAKFTTRVIYVSLRNRLARALKVEFELGKGRLLISEVIFINSKCVTNSFFIKLFVLFFLQTTRAILSFSDFFLCLAIYLYSCILCVFVFIETK